MDFKTSETKLNLMRAFAGESQARNRYDFAADIAKEQKQYVIEAVFKFTAGQEREHAKVFLNHLKDFDGQTIDFSAGYPVSTSNSVEELLLFAAHNEYAEYNDAYKSFAETAEKEGFAAPAASFKMIAEIEREHGDRFSRLAELVSKNMLYVSDIKCSWMCLNCGHIFEGTNPPTVCPVCSHDRGYFIRLELAPYTSAK